MNKGDDTQMSELVIHAMPTTRMQTQDTQIKKQTNIITDIPVDMCYMHVNIAACACQYQKIWTYCTTD